MFKERGGGFRRVVLGGIFVDMVKRKYGLKSISEASETNLLALDQHLESGSSVVYFNHTTLIDSPALIAFLLVQLSNIGRIGVLTSEKHYDISRRPRDGLMIRSASLIRVNPLRVVQSDDDHYSEQVRFNLNKSMFRQVKKILGEFGGTILIAPEGTRSPNGQLQKAEGEFDRFGKYGNVNFVPIGIIPEGNFDEGIRVGKVGLNVGEPYRFESLQIPNGLRPIDVAMKRLAGLLLPDMRGAYA